MKRLVLVLAAALILAGCGDDGEREPTTAPAPTVTAKCAPPATYLARGKPSPCLTPGVIRTSDPAVICVRGQASRVRRELNSAQWAERRKQVLARYGLTRNPGEIDHYLPLEGGGSNDVTNLFPQAAPYFHQKDLAENRLHRQICISGVTVEQVKRLQRGFLQAWGGMG